MISSKMAALIVAVALVASGATAVTGVSAQEEEFAGEEMMIGNMTGNMTEGNMTDTEMEASGNISTVLVP